MLREEAADYDVVPMPDGTQKQLNLLTGSYWTKGKYVDFHGEPVPEAGGLDGQLIEGFRDDLANEKSKDGLARDLFPLTSKEQEAYEFKLLGQELQMAATSITLPSGPKTRAK
jgi:hypothetical protein